MSKAKKPKKASAAAVEYSKIRIVSVEIGDPDAFNNLELLVEEGWMIGCCAGVRSDGFNRDTLYYTLVK